MDNKKITSENYDEMKQNNHQIVYNTIVVFDLIYTKIFDHQMK